MSRDARRIRDRRRCTGSCRGTTPALAAADVQPERLAVLIALRKDALGAVRSRVHVGRHHTGEHGLPESETSTICAKFTFVWP